LFVGPGPANDPHPTSFVVHANGNGTSSGVSGLIQVKSRDSSVLLNGPALQASALANGGQGGTIVVEAKLDVDTKATAGFTDGTVQARGTVTGGAPKGGSISIRSFGVAPAAGSILANAGSTVDVNASHGVEVTGNENVATTSTPASATSRMAATVSG